MKLINFFLVILIIFFKTGNVLSESNIFNVSNIEVLKKAEITNKQMSRQAIKKGFEELVNKILLDKDKEKISKLSFSQIQELVSYYQVTNKKDNDMKDSIESYNILFDKDKLHDLFFTKGISYSEIIDKQLYLLPILSKDDKIFIFNQNFFYENWNNDNTKDLIEFILLIENIEEIKNINNNKNNLLELNLNVIFKEYQKKNLALIYIDDFSQNKLKIFLKVKISGKEISRNLSLNKSNQTQIELYEKIIIILKNELTNIIKSENLIDVRRPSFLNVKLKLSKKNSLIELNKRLKKIESIENIYVQELNSKYVFLKIKYLGRLAKIIKQLDDQKILLEEIGNQWSFKLI